MLNMNSNSNYKTLKGWRDSAEHSRAKLLEQVKEAAAGIYKVRMDNSNVWQVMDRLPVNGASEWLYLNAKGVPIYYWNRDQSGLTII